MESYETKKKCHNNLSSSVWRFQVWLALGMIGLFVSCSMQTRQREPLLPELSKPRPAATEPADSTPQSKGLALVASALGPQGNLISVTVTNYLEKDILVGPKMFAVIVGRKIFPVKRGDVTIRFPVRKIGHNEGVSGEFHFRKMGPLAGEKIVLNCPDAGRYITKIETYQEALPEPPPRMLTPKELKRIQREQKKTRRLMEKERKKREKIFKSKRRILF